MKFEFEDEELESVENAVRLLREQLPPEWLSHLFDHREEIEEKIIKSEKEVETKKIERIIILYTNASLFCVLLTIHDQFVTTTNDLLKQGQS